MKKNKEYVTKDIWTSAFLLATGLKITQIARDKNVVYFHFDNREKAEVLTRDFLNGTATVSARKFVESFRNTKSLIYSKE